jgi:hydrogenase-4 membrane subunit HyfE
MFGKTALRTLGKLDFRFYLLLQGLFLLLSQRKGYLLRENEIFLSS